MIRKITKKRKRKRPEQDVTKTERKEKLLSRVSVTEMHLKQLTKCVSTDIENENYSNSQKRKKKYCIFSAIRNHFSQQFAFLIPNEKRHRKLCKLQIGFLSVSDRINWCMKNERKNARATKNKWINANERSKKRKKKHTQNIAWTFELTICGERWFIFVWQLFKIRFELNSVLFIFEMSRTIKTECSNADSFSWFWMHCNELKSVRRKCDCHQMRMTQQIAIRFYSFNFKCVILSRIFFSLFF